MAKKKATSDAKLKAAEDAATKKAMKGDKPGPYGPDYFKAELEKIDESPKPKSKPVDKSLAPSPDYTGPKDKLKENIEDYAKNYSGGGEVKSSNLYGWPTTDASKRKG